MLLGMWCAQVWSEDRLELLSELGDEYPSRTEACRACFDYQGEALIWTQDEAEDWWADGAEASYRVVQAL